MSGYNGSGPYIARENKTYVLPVLLYGLEALVLNDDEVRALEDITVVYLSISSVEILIQRTRHLHNPRMFIYLSKTHTTQTLGRSPRDGNTTFLPH